MKYLAPSILSADFGNLNSDIEKTVKAGSKYIHFDVMDGHFVPNISFGACILASIREKHDALFDVHLMIENPIDYLDDFLKLKPEVVTVHLESKGDTLKQIEKIKSYGVKAGVSVKPNTDLIELEPILQEIDMVLIMSVEPGFGGQGFIENSIEKIANLKKMITQKNLNTLIEVDGGINLKNIEDVAKAGADILVAGSAVFGGNIEENTKQLVEKLQKVG